VQAQKRKAILFFLRMGLMTILVLFMCHCTPAIKKTSKYSTHKGFLSLSSFAKGLKKKKYYPKRLALLIGIDKYKDKTWHSLRFATKDAKDLAKVLQNKISGQFDKVMLHIVPKDTTRKAILLGFKKLLKINRDPRDTIFVYVSGHGTLARDRKHRLVRYLVTYDATAKDISKSALSVSLLRYLFNQLKSDKKVMLLATCHSGSGKSRFNREMSSELKSLKGPFFIKPIEFVSKATIFLGVCGFGETAQESAVLKNDIYTHYFIKALKNKYDANGDGAVTVLEAHDYAKDLTYHYTRGRQRAYAESDILGSDPIILIGKKERIGKPVLYAYNNRFFGVEVQVNGRAKGTFPRGIEVKSGKQKITLLSQKGHKILFKGDVYFKPGERMEVTKLFYRKVFNFSLAAKGGYQFFLEGTSEDRMSRSLPLFGLDLKLRRPWAIPFDVHFSFAFSRNSHTLLQQDNRPQTVTELNLGVALTYNLKWRWISFFAGPRLSIIYLDRQSDLHPDINDFFYSFQPGILFGMELSFRERWSFFVESHLNYTYVTTEDGSPRHQGSYEIFAGIFFHF